MRLMCAAVIFALGGLLPAFAQSAATGTAPPPVPSDVAELAAVVVTGHTRISRVMKARECGAHFIVAKPITPAVLLQRIVWVSKDERLFIDCETYVGPDRRFRRLGPRPGIQGRRSDDLPAEVGEATEPNMDQSIIDNLIKPSKVAL